MDIHKKKKNELHLKNTSNIKAKYVNYLFVSCLHDIKMIQNKVKLEGLHPFITCSNLSLMFNTQSTLKVICQGETSHQITGKSNSLLA